MTVFEDGSSGNPSAWVSLQLCVCGAFPHLGFLWSCWRRRFTVLNWQFSSCLSQQSLKMVPYICWVGSSRYSGVALFSNLHLSRSGFSCILLLSSYYGLSRLMHSIEVSWCGVFSEHRFRSFSHQFPKERGGGGPGICSGPTDIRRSVWYFETPHNFFISSE